MIQGIGIDIIDLSCFRILIEESDFISHSFHPEEIQYCQRYRSSLEHYAGRYAAKKATQSALALSLEDWKDICILPSPAGPPFVQLSGKALQNTQHLPHLKLFLSISHTTTQAVAFVVVETSF